MPGRGGSVPKPIPLTTRKPIHGHFEPFNFQNDSDETVDGLDYTLWDRGGQLVQTHPLGVVGPHQGIPYPCPQEKEVVRIHVQWMQPGRPVTCDLTIPDPVNSTVFESFFGVDPGLQPFGWLTLVDVQGNPQRYDVPPHAFQ